MFDSTAANTPPDESTLVQNAAGHVRDTELLVCTMKPFPDVTLYLVKRFSVPLFYFALAPNQPNSNPEL